QRCFSSGAGDAAAPTERTVRSAPPTVRRLEQGLAAGVAVPTARTRWVHAAGCIGPGTASVPLRLPPAKKSLLRAVYTVGMYKSTPGASRGRKAEDPGDSLRPDVRVPTTAVFTARLH